MGATRRDIARAAAKSVAGLIVLADSRSLRTYRANEKIGVALIGCGGRGEWFVDTIPGLERIVAMCDVNAERAAKSYAKLPEVPKHTDFRRMLEASGRYIDAVIVAAPDHIHAPAAMASMKLGKPVFCEKPLAHDIAEARALRSAAARLRVVTQMGNQGTASEAFRRCCELIWAGAIGDVREVWAWNESGGSGLRQRPTDGQPVPPTLDWDLWLGPAPFRPYHPG
ncbi:MAG: Gfo/Idh/MocA family oxidoreductase, partial [Armatimonadetes bacterium]|nr:Gfo/Idh/MocA family oxidoreductase [Armatimonadota bacterium]